MNHINKKIITISKFNIYKNTNNTIFDCVLKIMFLFVLIPFLLSPIYLLFLKNLSVIEWILGIVITIIMIIFVFITLLYSFEDVFYEYDAKTLLKNFIKSVLEIDTIIITNNLIQMLFEKFLNDKDKNLIELILNIENLLQTIEILNKNYYDKDRDINITEDDIETLKTWLKLIKLNKENLILFNEQFKLIIEDKKLVIIECVQNVKRYYIEQRKMVESSC